MSRFECIEPENKVYINRYVEFKTKLRGLKTIVSRPGVKKSTLEDALLWLKAHLRSDAVCYQEENAVCHVEIAQVYQKLEDGRAAMEHWREAEELYYKLAFSHKAMNLPTYNEHASRMEYCSSRVSLFWLSRGNQMAGRLNYSCLSEKYARLGDEDKSVFFLFRAMKLREGTSLCCPNDLNSMLCLFSRKAHVRSGTWSKFLAMWNLFAKPNKSSINLNQLLSLEAKIMLIILLTFVSSPNALHDCQHQHLMQYENAWENAYRRTSVANKQDFETFARFIRAVKEGNYLEVVQLEALSLRPLLDKEGRTLCTSLTTKMTNPILFPTSEEISTDQQQQSVVDNEEKEESVGELLEKRSTLLQASEERRKSSCSASYRK